jgi:hypothetical protein
VARRHAKSPWRSCFLSLESAFAKVVGREPSKERRKRQHRLRDALALNDDDAF